MHFSSLCTAAADRSRGLVNMSDQQPTAQAKEPGDEPNSEPGTGSNAQSRESDEEPLHGTLGGEETPVLGGGLVEVEGASSRSRSGPVGRWCRPPQRGDGGGRRGICSAATRLLLLSCAWWVALALLSELWLSRFPEHNPGVTARLLLRPVEGAFGRAWGRLQGGQGAEGGVRLEAVAGAGEGEGADEWGRCAAPWAAGDGALGGSGVVPFGEGHRPAHWTVETYGFVLQVPVYRRGVGHGV